MKYLLKVAFENPVNILLTLTLAAVVVAALFVPGVWPKA